MGERGRIGVLSPAEPEGRHGSVNFNCLGLWGVEDSGIGTRNREVS